MHVVNDLRQCHDHTIAGLLHAFDVAEDRPVRGVCRYSRGDQYDWDTALVEPVGRVTEVGLFDAERRPRPVADAYARLAAERRSRE